MVLGHADDVRCRWAVVCPRWNPHPKAQGRSVTSTTTRQVKRGKFRTTHHAPCTMPSSSMPSRRLADFCSQIRLVNAYHFLNLDAQFQPHLPSRQGFRPNRAFQPIKSQRMLLLGQPVRPTRLGIGRIATAFVVERRRAYENRPTFFAHRLVRSSMVNKKCPCQRLARV